MTDTQPAQPPVEDYGSRRAGPASARIGQWILIAIMAAVSSLVSTNNWCVVIIPAMLAAILVDNLAFMRTQRRLPRLITGVIIGTLIGLAFRVGPDWAFKETFGVPAPAGASDVWVQRHYIGGPGEHVLLMAFNANDETLQTLLSAHPLVANNDRIEAWRSRGSHWSDIWDTFVLPTPNPLARSSWDRIPPFKQVEIHTFDTVNTTGGYLYLLHDPTAGRCVVLDVRI